VPAVTHGRSAFARAGGTDIAVAPDGTAYVTDSVSDAVLRVDVAGHASVLVRDPRFFNPTTPAGFGLNGIVWHPGGYLLVVKSRGGQLYRITTAPRPTVHAVATPPVYNDDALLLRRDGTLLAVTNPLGPQGVSAVEILTSRDRWTTTTKVRILPWPDPTPTTATATPDGDYVLDGHLNVLFGGSGPADEFTIRRI
jgi:hypothetical protein